MRYRCSLTHRIEQSQVAGEGTLPESACHSLPLARGRRLVVVDLADGGDRRLAAALQQRQRARLVVRGERRVAARAGQEQLAVVLHGAEPGGGEEARRQAGPCSRRRGPQRLGKPLAA